ncbi:hypothetical protein E0493_22390 [Roseomonas sp. M0104]|uniref:PhnA-like protein n=1 Tax=Teichococcus coralli TaxID=2545983 RepID=A0A845BLG9_9PROT|nr:hypothetical protein [Pseudoroseomonas coralli]MXP66097.1 hypothetical protein [Pseudoroseomonas coralli]
MPPDTTSTVRAATILPEGGPALPSRVSWGAVIAGSLIAAVLAATLNILGTAIGATTVDAVAHATPGAARMGIGAAIWLVIANTLALAAGGYTAARLSGTADDTDGILHGLAVWALAFLVYAVLIGNLLASLASTATNAIGSVAGGAASAVAETASQAMPDVSPKALVDRARDTLRGAGGDPQAMTSEQRSAEITSLLGRRIARGEFSGEQRARLDALVAAEFDIPPEEASRRVQAMEAEAQRTAAEAAERARQAADATARATSIGAFGTFAALLIGAVAAVLGARRGTRDRVALLMPGLGRRPA